MSQAARKPRLESVADRESVTDIQAYYGGSQRDRRFEKHQLEYLVTARLFRHYLKPYSEVLEIGAGWGYHTQQLAAQGHQVCAVDFSAPQIELNKALIAEEKLDKNVTHLVADARDVPSQLDQAFDAVLVMGPLYHLGRYGERRDLLRGLGSLLKPGGLIFSCYLTRIGYVSTALSKSPAWILLNRKKMDQFWKKGIEQEHPKNGSFRGYFCNLPEIRELDAECGFATQAIHCQDPAIGAVDEIFNRLPPPLKDEWADFLFSISDDPALFGSGRSVMSVARKK